MLERVAGWCYRRRRVVLAAWLVLLIGVNVLSSAQGNRFALSFHIPDSDAQQAQDLLTAKFPAAAGTSTDVVFASNGPVSAPATKARIDDLVAELGKISGVKAAVSPFGPGAFEQVSDDGTIAYARLQFSDAGALPPTLVDQVQERVEQARGGGLKVELSAQQFAAQEKIDSEGIGLLAAVLILLVAFGSVLAMGLPIGTALFGVGVGLASVNLLSNFVTMPSFVIELATMIGIGVGIDYALFIVTRYRQGLTEGKDPRDAVAEAVSTSGKAVVFAGTTVIISLLGMFAMGISFVNGMALGAATAVLVTMLCALTLLPAVLGFVGHTIDKLALPWAANASRVDLKGFWYRWSRAIQRRPWPFAAIGLLILLTLAWPVFSIRLGTSDAQSLPASDTTHQAFDLLDRGFGSGFNGPLLVAIRVPDKAAAAALPALSAAVGKAPGVAKVTPAVSNPQGDAALMEVVPDTGPEAAATVSLIHRLRDEVLPTATRGTGLQAHVGGVTAAFDDLATVLGARLPYFIGAVLVLSFLLLLAVFRSVLVPLKAVIMNLLSIGAAYGVLVAVFQYGWGRNLIGLGSTGPIESFMPMTMFAILFGLSMDYEVFLLSRIKEEWDRTGHNATAVSDGLSHTARVITAAAAIMACVFASFVFADSRVIKEFGLGMAVAVLVDATVVRMVLVPATMELLGKTNWWMPAWLDRILPSIKLEAPVRPISAPGPRVEAPASGAPAEAAEEEKVPAGR